MKKLKTFHLRSWTVLKEYVSNAGRVVWGTAWMQISLITALGGLLRLFGLLHGLQENFLYHPDTNITLNEVWPKFLGQNWLAGSYNGAFYNLLLSYLIGIAETLIRLLGYTPGAWSIEQISTIASLLAAILGTATIPIVYLLGLNAYNKTTGVLAALFLSLCPLHTFHSHYPYRDVPMVFFLTLTLLFCIRIIKKPTLVVSTLGGAAAILTVGLKPAGLVIIVPLMVALSMALYRERKSWWRFIPIGFLIALGMIFFARGGISSRFTTTENLMAFLLENQEGVFRGVLKVGKILIQWLGFPYLLATVVGAGYGLKRRTSGDTILVTFLLTAFLAAASYLWLDDRFLVFLLPAMAVLLGRLIAETWQACLNKRILRIAIFFVAAGLAFNALLESTWQGILFSLPDTRAVSGRWLEAHFPRNIRVATEGYHPLGLDLWPRAFYLDPKHPLDEEAAKADILVTSSLEHQRYFSNPKRYPKQTNFFKSLQWGRPTIKQFSLGPHGFIQPDIGIYSPYPLPSPALHLSLPRPYDAKWNFGLSFLDPGPFDRDDRTIRMGWGHRYAADLVSPKTGQEIVVFMLNGTEESVVKVRVGFTTKIRTLKPEEFHLLTFRPEWIFPKKPALYYFEAGVPQGEKVLIQLRCGNREIGEAFAKWGLYKRAVPYLQQALAVDDPANPETNLLLGLVYEKLGEFNKARQTISHLIKNHPRFIHMVRSLGHPGLSLKNWEHEFQKFSGFSPSLLTSALSQEFNADRFIRSPAGSVEEDCRVSGGQIMVFEKNIHKPDEVMNGPYAYLDQGAYKANFFIRTWDKKGTGPFVEIKVWAGTKILSILSVRAGDLDNRKNPFQEIKIPFQHLDPRAQIHFHVFATGQASFAIEKVRIEPDLQQLFKNKLMELDSIAEPLS